MVFQVEKATAQDASAVASMACQIWHSSSVEELTAEFSRMADEPEQAVFLIRDGESPCGFAQCGLRRDYVEGTRSSPVGYLEGIFVKQEYRNKGCARMLLGACEQWAKDMGCTEFASDCELTNTESLFFHLNVGFSEANRIICFTKQL